jgi:NTP pyrophosphatase (non-canonical NTP hydrolase)
MDNKENTVVLKLDFDTLRIANVSRCEEVFHKLDDWSPTDWATAMAGEAGEACNQVKKLRRLDGADAAIDTPEERARIIARVAEELADNVIYSDLLAARLGINLPEAVASKFNKVSEECGSVMRLQYNKEVLDE